MSAQIPTSPRKRGEVRQHLRAIALRADRRALMIYFTAKICAAFLATSGGVR